MKDWIIDVLDTLEYLGQRYAEAGLFVLIIMVMIMGFIVITLFGLKLLSLL